MKKNGRRILSVILTAVMVFALLPIFGKPMVVKAETMHMEHTLIRLAQNMRNGAK